MLFYIIYHLSLFVIQSVSMHRAIVSLKASFDTETVKTADVLFLPKVFNYLYRITNVILGLCMLTILNVN